MNNPPQTIEEIGEEFAEFLSLGRGGKTRKECCDYLVAKVKEVRQDTLREIEDELMNGKLRDSFENYFEKDNIDKDGNYLNRKSTTNRSGALAYLGDINSFLRNLLKANTNSKTKQ